LEKSKKEISEIEKKSRNNPKRNQEKERQKKPKG
jgi:hypothetical protein